MLKRRKLALKTETIRTLTSPEMSRVVGGRGTVDTRCSTIADSNCCVGGTVWGCGNDPTVDCTAACGG